MNREIKFRAWCKQREEWIDIRRIFFNECESSYVEDYDGEIYFPERKDWELMQYTGLKDAKGIEIYEGDILTTDLSRPYKVVVFRNGSFMYLCHDNGKDYYDIILPLNEKYDQDNYSEVIGNIYENPELLEVES